MVERIRQEEKDSKKERYPWLDDMDERKCMMDREILDKYIDLKDSCLEEIKKGKLWKCYMNIKMCLG